MLEPRIAKVVVNIGVGASGERLEKAAKLLEQLVKQEPSLRRAKRSIKEFNVKRGEPIAVAVTLRGSKALEFLDKALAAIGRRVKYSSFDDYGNVSFGIKEHIMLPGAKYDPDIGIFGMDVVVKLERPGYRVMRRRRCRSSVPRRHRVSREEAVVFFMNNLGVKVVGLG
ncbi:MAG: 50S ribosomal protein L5 [Sulfolobales archaeon]|nr:50S ribosomal protein L5 [Sulfolobales archaeon]MCX8208875.1 50S ribosomal protein L5 [Sulfolobales archaeon]MDW8010712.1 50S ribosomal protein L5 [Sulfolobales archaeon]